MPSDAEKRYQKILESVETQIGHLQDCVENHALGEQVDWGHVIDLDHVDKRLRELVIFMHGEVNND